MLVNDYKIKECKFTLRFHFLLLAHARQSCCHCRRTATRTAFVLEILDSQRLLAANR